MNNKRPMFSIIIPAYNIGTCISDSIASVLGQDFRDFECIIVDDGSTDGSGAIAAELIKGDDRFVLFEQKNKGVSAARNKGFEESKGKYILFLDGDDIFQVNLLGTVYNRLKVRDVDLLIYNYKIIDNITGRVGSPVHELKEYAEEEVVSPIYFANKIFNTFELYYFIIDRSNDLLISAFCEYMLIHHEGIGNLSINCFGYGNTSM